MKIVVLGLSITSSWGNGHATTYRALLRALKDRGHQLHFFEADRPWYASNRDLPVPPYCRTTLYKDLTELKQYSNEIESADCVIVGSYVPDGVQLGRWITGIAKGVTAFYDIDTPVTLAKLGRGDFEYLCPSSIARYDLYLSFTGGPTLEVLRTRYGAANPHAFYCSVDPEHYFPEQRDASWDLGYLGTYSADRQPSVEQFLITPACHLPGSRFVVAGPQYPENVQWPGNVKYIHHLDPGSHRQFYNSQRYTLNVTRQDMVRAGWSPSVRLFEAAACGTPIISDAWEGLADLFTPGREILIARSSSDVTEVLQDLPEAARVQIAQQARAKVLEHHTSAHRAKELEELVTNLRRGETVARQGGTNNVLEPQQVAS